jgi:hypothetical protein
LKTKLQTSNRIDQLHIQFVTGSPNLSLRNPTLYFPSISHPWGTIFPKEKQNVESVMNASPQLSRLVVCPRLRNCDKENNTRSDRGNPFICLVYCACRCSGMFANKLIYILHIIQYCCYIPFVFMSLRGDLIKLSTPLSVNVQHGPPFFGAKCPHDVVLHPLRSESDDDICDDDRIFLYRHIYFSRESRNVKCLKNNHYEKANLCN